MRSAIFPYPKGTCGGGRLLQSLSGYGMFSILSHGSKTSRLAIVIFVLAIFAPLLGVLL